MTTKNELIELYNTIVENTKAKEDTALIGALFLAIRFPGKDDYYAMSWVDRIFDGSFIHHGDEETREAWMSALYVAVKCSGLIGNYKDGMV